MKERLAQAGVNFLLESIKLTMKTILKYSYRTKNEGNKEAIFELQDSELVEITIEDKRMKISFVELADMLHEAAKELKDSESPSTKRRAVALLISNYITPLLNYFK